MHTSAEAAATPIATGTDAPPGMDPTAPVAKMKKIDPPGLSRKRKAMAAPAPDTSEVMTTSTQTEAPRLLSRAPMPTQTTRTAAAIDCRLVRDRGDSKRA